MEFRAVGNRCAVALDSLKLPILEDEALAILILQGFKVVDVDLVALARQCVETSRYRRGARLYEAPAVVDCSSLIKWLYGQRGIWLPRRSIQQRKLGLPVFAELVAGDVVFASGAVDYYDENPALGVGHVGIATGEGTVIHAANTKEGVTEVTLAAFEGSKGRGFRRYIPTWSQVLTLETPPNREVEVADDIRWIILQSVK